MLCTTPNLPPPHSSPVSWAHCSSMTQLIIFPAVLSAWDILAAEFAELALHFIRALLKYPLLRKAFSDNRV